MLTRWKTWRGRRRLKRMIDDWEATMCPGLERL
jgi:hypothetical protein